LSCWYEPNSDVHDNTLVTLSVIIFLMPLSLRPDQREFTSNLKFLISQYISFENEFTEERYGRRSLSEREKLAVVRYWEEVKSEKPNMLVKEICDKASRIFDVNIIAFSKLQFFFMTKSCFRFIRQLHAKSLMNTKALILLELQKRKDAVKSIIKRTQLFIK
jgi:hypothetical protein